MQQKINRQLGFVLLALGLLLSFMPRAGLCQASVEISPNTAEYDGKIYHLHNVQAQQTLYGISRAYGVTVESILMANPDARRGIRINQVIRVPAGGNLKAESMTVAPPQTAENVSDEFEYVYHVAGKNENFAYLANTFLVSEQSIRQANPSRNEPFREGDYILIPVAKKDKRPPVTDLQQLQRSNYDPYNTSVQAERNRSITTQDIPPSTTKVETILPFEVKSEQNTPAQKNNPTQPATTVSPYEAKPAETKPSINQHVVKPKETVFGIARQYNISPDELMKANPGIASSLKAGQVIKIPESGTKQNDVALLQTTDSLFYHTVEKGQTLYSISRTYAVSINELKRINPELTESLRVGQKILIPKKKITTSYFIHKVETAQRSKQLAREFNISKQELYDLNPSVGKRLYPEQKIKIPVEEGFVTQPLPPGEPVLITKNDPGPDSEELLPAPIEENESSECIGDPRYTAQVYRVALLLPLYLEQLENGVEFDPSSPEQALKAASFIHFYNGFVMAADSLARNFGLNLELLVFDVDQNLQKLDQTLADQRLRNVNLIVGPFFSQPFDRTAGFARTHGIPIVNPMSQRSEIISNNPYVIKVKPNQNSLYTQVAATIAQKYPNAKVFLYQANAYRHQNEINALRSALESTIPPTVSIDNASIAGFFKQYSHGRSNRGPGIRSEGSWLNVGQFDLISHGSTEFNNQLTLLSYDKDNIDNFARLASAVRDNIVVVYSEDRVFAMEFANKLNQVADTVPIKMFALPQWSRFDNLFNENLLRLGAHFTTASLVDYESLKTEFFIFQYRMKHQSEPDAFAFEGFDIGYYFLTAMQKFGPDFLKCLPQYHQKLLQTSFRLSQPGKDDGLENSYWNIYKLVDYRQIIVED